jgi:hypothetical protein
MKESGMLREMLEMVEEHKYGQTVHYMRVIGETTKQMVKVD